MRRSAQAAAVLAIAVTAGACTSPSAAPAVTAVVDDLRPTHAGAVYVHLTLTNDSELSRWVNGCAVRLARPGGRLVEGTVKGVTIVPAHGTEPLQGIVFSDGSPVSSGAQPLVVRDGPGACTSSPNKRDVVPTTPSG